MPRLLKTLILFYSMLANHHTYYSMACLTGTFKIIAIDFYGCILSGIIRRVSSVSYDYGWMNMIKYLMNIISWEL